MAAQFREQAHSKAKGLMRQGQFRDAINEILHALGNFGSHVGLISDLAVCFFRTGQMHKWRSSLKKLATEFGLCRDKLSLPSRLRTALILAKFFEEEGEISLALNLLHQEMDGVEDLSGASEAQLKVLASLVRLQALLGRSAGLTSWCRSLEQAKSSCSPGIQIEIEHALMLHQLELVGPHLGFARLKDLLQRSELDAYDRELVIYDYVEASMAVGRAEWNEDIRALLQEPVESAFAQMLRNWLSLPRTESWVWRPQSDLRVMTCSEFLRSALLYVRQVSGEEAAGVKASLDLQLRDLTAESRSAWMERFRSLRPEHDIALSRRDLSLKSGDSLLRFKGKPVAMNFVSLLVLRPSWPLEEFCRRLLDTELSEENYTRIRVMAFRINRQAADALKLEKLIQVTKQSVSLAENIKLTEESWSAF